jgi:hypothetical protein
MNPQGINPPAACKPIRRDPRLPIEKNRGLIFDLFLNCEKGKTLWD